MTRKAKAISEKHAKEDSPASPHKRAMAGVPDDLWMKCPGCGSMLYSKDLEQDLKVCRRCGYHLRISASERIAFLADGGSFEEHDAELRTGDPLGFPGYQESLNRYREETGRTDSMVWGEATIEGRPVILGVSEFGFMGGSMGSVMGEKVARAAEKAIETRRPLILVCSGGGARMHEGIISLMQMAKTTAAIARLGEAGIPYIAIFVDPMMAGIDASYAFIADIIIAEPGAIVGFAGPRVVAQAYRIKLPPGQHERGIPPGPWHGGYGFAAQGNQTHACKTYANIKIKIKLHIITQ
jgi:acetyl-CoA carboxylase carboxyl transferase subunit beta